VSRAVAPRRKGARAQRADENAISFAKPVRATLLRWYRANRRDLPWRRTRDPYAIWISETMLQQTRVETVIPYYERFLARFPDVGALATADLDAVLGEWAGLGYYARARNLRSAAQHVVERFAGRVPDHVEALRSLPGVGRYTAGAVASIAFDRPEPVVDGNVARVLTRLLGIRGDVKTAPLSDRLWSAAGALSQGRAPGDLNQALMELGATLCTPRAPGCPRCPLTRHCAARSSGNPESFPETRRRPAARSVEGIAALVTRGSKILAVRRPARGLLGGLWELPGGELHDGEPPQRGLRRTLRERVGLSISRPCAAGVVDHVFSHFRLRLHVYRCAAASGARVRRDGPDRHLWLSRAALDRLPKSSVGCKAIDVALESASR
jgi:A/G-specific adenine glycosylase